MRACIACYIAYIHVCWQGQCLMGVVVIMQPHPLTRVDRYAISDLTSHIMATGRTYCWTIWRRLARLSFVAKRWYSTNESVKLFSELRGLHPLILEKLTQQKLLELTEIQGKVCTCRSNNIHLCMPLYLWHYVLFVISVFFVLQCLPDLLSETSYTKSCIINAETGSGKTLCEYGMFDRHTHIK